MASIEKRGNSYRIVVSLGYDIYHKQIKESTTFTPDMSLLTKTTKAAREKELRRMVEEYAAEFERKLKNGQILDGSKTTLQEFSEKWLSDYCSVSLQAKTIEGYKIHLDSKILPALGHLKLSEITPAKVNAFYANLARPGAKADGTAYSIGSIRKIAGVLSSMLGKAAEWEIIQNNPCDRAKPKVAEEYKAEKVKAWTPEQTARFVQFIQEPLSIKVNGFTRSKGTSTECKVSGYTHLKPISLQMQVLILLALHTAARKGELLALTWDDIDFDAQTVTICKSASSVNGKQIIKVTKSKSSNRENSLNDGIINLLKQYKAAQAKTIMERRDYWHNHGFLFTQDNGEMMDYGTPYHSFTALIDSYNSIHEDTPLPKISFHDLRHTALSALAANNVDVVTVAAIAGHSSSAVTQKFYLHAFEAGKKKAADTLGDLFSPSYSAVNQA